MGNIRSLPDLISLIRRRLPLVLLIFVLGSLATLFVASRQIRAWESTAVLQMELPGIAASTSSETLLRSGQRLQLLEQQLSSRDSLLDLAERFDVFAGAPAMSATDKLAIMRQSVRLLPVRPPQQPYGGEQAISAMLIQVTMPNPNLAADMANDLANQVLNGTALRQSQILRDTLTFFAEEEERIQSDLTSLNAELTAFKNDNLESLPEGLASRRSEAAALEEQMRLYDQQRIDLQQELAPLLATANPRAVEQRSISQLQARLDAVNSQRTTLQTQLSAIRAAIAGTPIVETRLNEYLRRQVQLNEQLAEITNRRAAAATSQRLDSDQQTERFTLLEAAIPADYPASSGRRKLMAVGGLASGAIAVAFAFLLELRHPAIRSARQMEQILQIRPVIALPDLGPQRNIRRGAGISWLWRRFQWPSRRL